MFMHVVSVVSCCIGMPVWQAAILVFPLDFSDYITEKEYYSSVFEVVYWKLLGSSAAVAVQKMRRSVSSVRWKLSLSVCV